MHIRRALLSVYDKANIIQLASVLAADGVEILSSGGTASALRSAGIAVTDVSQVTSSPEMLDGRVKTLHPRIHGALLALRTDPSHMSALHEHGIEPIDLVVVNLYPFTQMSQQPDMTLEQILEYIDIGGPSMLRSAAKNYQSVCVLSSPSQYDGFLEKYKSQHLDYGTLQDYAAAAFACTAAYDQAITEYFAGLMSADDTAEPPVRQLSLQTVQPLRYGENPHQTASLCRTIGSDGACIEHVRQLHGKELSYNNWLDMDAAWALISEFEPEIPACAIIKHNIPCGVALADTPADAYSYALDCDPVSSFGGIVSFNCAVDEPTADRLAKTFLEVIIATGFTEGAMHILQKKANLRLVTAPLMQTASTAYRSIFGDGVLCQSTDCNLLDKENLTVVTEASPPDDAWVELLFAFRVAKHVKSNAIVIVNGNRTVGICGGQTSRVNAVDLALKAASDLADGAVLASDGFFPFADNVDLIAQTKIRAIIQPGGSVRDPEVIDSCNKHNIPMVFTGVRHFRH